MNYVRTHRRSLSRYSSSDDERIFFKTSIFHRPNLSNKIQGRGSYLANVESSNRKTAQFYKNEYGMSSSKIKSKFKTNYEVSEFKIENRGKTSDLKEMIVTNYTNNYNKTRNNVTFLTGDIKIQAKEKKKNDNEKDVEKKIVKEKEEYNRLYNKIYSDVNDSNIYNNLNLLFKRSPFIEVPNKQRTNPTIDPLFFSKYGSLPIKKDKIINFNFNPGLTRSWKRKIKVTKQENDPEIVQTLYNTPREEILTESVVSFFNKAVESNRDHIKYDYKQYLFNIKDEYSENIKVLKEVYRNEIRNRSTSFKNKYQTKYNLPLLKKANPSKIEDRKTDLFINTYTNSLPRKRFSIKEKKEVAIKQDNSPKMPKKENRYVSPGKFIGRLKFENEVITRKDYMTKKIKEQDFKLKTNLNRLIGKMKTKEIFSNGD